MKRKAAAIAAIFTAAFMTLMPMNASAEYIDEIPEEKEAAADSQEIDDDDMSEYEYVEATAEDGAVFRLKYRKNEDGTLTLYSYKIVKEIIPKNEDDFPPHDGEGPYYDNEIYAKVSKGEVLAVTDFNVHFPERPDNVDSIFGSKYYLIDTGAQSVRYAGEHCDTLRMLSPEESENELIQHNVTAEDGTECIVKLWLKDSTYAGYDIVSISQPEDEYDFPDYKGGTGIDGKFYSDPWQIPLTEGQELITPAFYDEKEDGTVLNGTKYYIIDTSSKPKLIYAGYTLSMGVERTAEDGTIFQLNYDSSSDYELMFGGYAMGHVFPADEYDFPEFKDGTGTYYSDPSLIPLEEDQEITEYSFEITDGDGTVLTGKKYYLIDLEKRTVTYMGHSIGTDNETVRDTATGGNSGDGFTDIPHTGNDSGAMATAMAVCGVSLGIMALTCRVLRKKI